VDYMGTACNSLHGLRVLYTQQKISRIAHFEKKYHNFGEKERFSRYFLQFTYSNKLKSGIIQAIPSYSKVFKL